MQSSSLMTSSIIGRQWITRYHSASPERWTTCDTDTDSSDGESSGISACSSVASFASTETGIGDCVTKPTGAIITSKSRSSMHRRSFRIATYNVLTDRCIRAGQYEYCPEEIRYMPARHVTIMAEVKEMSPDIICFQEVDHLHFVTRLKPAMESLGYGGILHRRADDQGLATFWNTMTFDLVDQKHSILHHLAETYLQMTSLSSAELSTVRESITRPEAVLCVLLRHLTSDSLLAVGNIHVTWSQLRFPALQALQIATGAGELTDFVNSRVVRSSRSDGVHSCCAQILLGDFNSPPDSLGYQLLSRGQISNVGTKSSTLVTKVDLETKTEVLMDQLRSTGLFNVLPSETFCVKTPFSSAYNTVVGSEPPVTNCDGDCQDYRCILCLDYIWYSRQTLDVVAVLQTPSVEQVTKHYALPSVDFPSDHIPLLAQFCFK